MDELKELVGLINQLPQLALWVLTGFWAYKVICVGTMFGVIRFITLHLYKWKTQPKQYVIKSSIITEATKDSLEIEISRLGKVTSGTGYNYIHDSDVNWLRTKIDERMAEILADNVNFTTRVSGGARGSK